MNATVKHLRTSMEDPVPRTVSYYDSLQYISIPELFGTNRSLRINMG